MTAIIFAGFILGLTSNFHCVGMCGPIALAIPLDRSSKMNTLFGALLYHGGRVLTYGILGVVVGSIGLTIETLGLLQWLSIIAGILMIVYAWRKYIHFVHPTLKFEGVNRFVSKGIGKLLKVRSTWKLIPMGMLNGILPCGMVFAGLFNAAIAGDMISGGLSMIAFGIATLPMMLVVSFFAGRLNSGLRVKFNTVVPYLLTVVGLMIILRGMNLGIPFISPKLNVAQEQPTTENEAPQMEMSCCHSATSCEK